MHQETIVKQFKILLVEFAGVQATSQARVFYFRTALQQRPWFPLVT
jgi:hypothetical protein